MSFHDNLASLAPSFRPLVLTFCALLLVTPSAWAETPKPVDIDWSKTARELQGRIGQDFVFRCAPEGRVGSLWGTDIYTTDSSICTAAAHAGWITVKGGGLVILRVQAGRDFYVGIQRHGIRSSEYGAYGGSFEFVKQLGAPDVERPASIGWRTTATPFRGRLDQSFRLVCPPNGQVASLWGTDVYTVDSGICTAAVHAGKITMTEGGPVEILILPGQESYNGLERNGVTSRSYGAYGGSFRFVDIPEDEKATN